MKPWRPYWKGLDLLMSEFLASPEPPQFAGVHKIHEWISGLKFPELMITHDKCYQLAEALSSGAFPGYHPTFFAASARWISVAAVLGNGLPSIGTRIGRRSIEGS